jgi:DNA polymerase-4
MLRHAELDRLAIAHVDCDAFYAAVEKRDRPELRDKPVIVGGGKRGVVATACYIARINGVRSAMPMFKALKLCPNAVVVKPDHAKYSTVGREVKTMMRALTPLVESVSIDEAFLDLSGTERVHGMSPARVLARFAKRVESEIGITVSVGLAPNKFLSKIASDLDKPRGFACIGQAEAISFLDDKPVRILPGIGAAAAERLAHEGINLVGDIRRADMRDFVRRHGAYGLHLWQLANGEDRRQVRSERETKSVSSETTFNEDISDANELTTILWKLSERVSARLKAAEFSGSRVTLKLKTRDFKSRTRSRTLDAPTRLASRIFETGRELLIPEARGEHFRLIGIGVEELAPIADGDPPDLLDPGLKRRIAAEDAMDRIRGKFGTDAVGRGIGFGRKV